MSFFYISANFHLLNLFLCEYNACSMYSCQLSIVSYGICAQCIAFLVMKILL